jgi:DsbC/DsbD-like thiol-disulfide interchange protein
MRRIRALLPLVFGFLSPVVGGAQVSAELVPEHTTVRPGDRTRVAIVLRHAPGWHTYWRRGGDAGLPTTVRWTPIIGVRIDTLQWPAPRRFVDLGTTTFGYDFDVPLVADVVMDRSVPIGRVQSLAGRVDWLACQTQCVPGSASVVSVVKTGAARVVNPAFARALQAPAVAWPAASSRRSLSARVEASSIRLTVAGELRGSCRFFPETKGVPADLSNSVLSASQRTSTTAVAANRLAALPDTVRGVLRCDDKSHFASFHVTTVTHR